MKSYTSALKYIKANSRKYTESIERHTYVTLQLDVIAFVYGIDAIVVTNDYADIIV